MEKTFTISTGSKVFNCILGVFLIGFSIFLFNISGKAGLNNASALILLLPVLLLLAGVIVLLNQFRAKIIIDKERIQKINLFVNKTIQIADIKGVRIGAKTVFIEAMSGMQVTLSNYDVYKDSDQLIEWLKGNFADLDIADLSEQETKVLADINLGVTEDDRKAKLGRAKAVAITYNITGAIIAFSVIPFSNYAVTCLLLLYPISGIVIMALSKGLVRVVSNNKRSLVRFILLGLILPVFMMLIKSLGEFDILNYGHVWLPFFAITIAIFVLLIIIGINKTIPTKGQWVLILLIAVLYGYGSTIQINCMFDQSIPKNVITAINNKYTEYHKGTDYYLILAAWDADNKAKTIEVSRDTYNKYNIGNGIVISLKNGVLDIPWYYIRK
jgi:hypothetical protein